MRVPAERSKKNKKTPNPQANKSTQDNENHRGFEYPDVNESKEQKSITSDNRSDIYHSSDNKLGEPVPNNAAAFMPEQTGDLKNIASPVSAGQFKTNTINENSKSTQNPYLHDDEKEELANSDYFSDFQQYLLGDSVPKSVAQTRGVKNIAARPSWLEPNQSSFDPSGQLEANTQQYFEYATNRRENMTGSIKQSSTDHKENSNNYSNTRPDQSYDHRFSTDHTWSFTRNQREKSKETKKENLSNPTKNPITSFEYPDQDNSHSNIRDDRQYSQDHSPFNRHIPPITTNTKENLADFKSQQKNNFYSHTNNTLPQLTGNRGEKSKEINNRSSIDLSKNVSQKNLNDRQHIASNPNKRFNDRPDSVTDYSPPMKKEQLNRPHGYSSDYDASSSRLTGNWGEKSKEINHRISLDLTKNSSQRNLSDHQHVASNSNKWFNNRPDSVTDYSPPMKQEEIDNQTSLELSKNSSQRNLSDHQHVASNSNKRFNNRPDSVTDYSPPMKQEEIDNQTSLELSKNSSQRNLSDHQHVASNSNKRFNNRPDSVTDYLPPMKQEEINNQTSLELSKNSSKRNLNDHQHVASNPNKRSNNRPDSVTDYSPPMKQDQLDRPYGHSSDHDTSSLRLTGNRGEKSKEINNRTSIDLSKNVSQRNLNVASSPNTRDNNSQFNNRQDSVANHLPQMEQEQSHYEQYFAVSFHVHMPSSLKKENKITVLGNIPELGEWKNICVTFRYYGVGYWISEPIKISMSSLAKLENVYYKYAILKTRSSWIGKKETTASYEGSGPKDNRVLTLGKENYYDIWMGNSEYPMRNLKECLFVKDIYSSLSEDNLKYKIMEYQSLREAYRNLIISTTNLNFIENHAREVNTSNQKIFLCILLGYHIEHNANHNFQDIFKLPESFPSIPLLECLSKITSDSLPTNSPHLLSPAISALVRQNSSPKFNGFEWMNLFAAAPVVDPNYNFLNDVQKWECDENNSILLQDCLENKVKPVIDNLELTNVYMNIVKKLISLTTTIDMVAFLWQDIIRSEFTRDSFLYSDFHDHVREHFYKLIASKNAEALLECLDIMPKDFNSLVAPNIRSKVFEILNNQNYHWTKKSVDAISRLLCEDRLFWTTDSAFRALDLVNKSREFHLVENFPRFLQNMMESVFESKEQSFWRKLTTVCTKWYQHMLLIDNVAGRQANGNVVNEMFFYLSQIYPIVAEVESITDRLQAIAIKQAEHYNHDLVFRATSLIGNNVHTKVQDCFERMIKKRLDDVVQKSDQKLLGHIMDICGCDNQNQLKVPNKLSDEILLYIMNRLQKQISDSSSAGKIVSDNFHAALLESSDFWVVILQATGTVKRLNSNMLIQKVKVTIVQLAETIKESTIKITLLRNVLKHSNQKLVRYFGAVKNYKAKITENELQAVREEYIGFEDRFRHLNDFYTRFCSDSKLIDAEEYSKDIDNRIQSFEDITLSDLSSSDYWEIHDPILNIAEKSNIFINSQTFSNVFESCLKSKTEELSVLTVAEDIMPNALIKYENLIKKCNNLKMIKVSDALLLWGNTKNIDEELKFLSNMKYLKSPKELKDSIRDLVFVPKWKDRLENLTKAAKTLVSEKDGIVAKLWKNSQSQERLAKLLKNIQNQEISFGELSQTIKEVNKVYGGISDNCWSLIEELSIAEEFIKFLKKIATHDLKNLINAVDDHSDERLIQEDTVSSLIQVKHFLLPIIDAGAEISSIEAFIKELTSISDKNPVLSKKISLCNLHRLALENMCNNILSKGEVTKKRIKNAVTIGIYEFQRSAKEDNCMVLLTYNRQGDQLAQQYSLNDLLDLRGRALLIAKSANTAKPMAIDDEDEDDFDENCISTFVHYMDLVQEILKVASKLIQLGHFLYREFQEKVEVANEGEIDRLLEKLTDDLTDWETTISQAQEQYYYLTFYSARHILTFYDYFFEDSKDLEIKNNCEILLKYVNQQAKLPPPDKNQTNYGTVSFDKIFGEIGKILHDIFEATPKRNRDIHAAIDCIHSDVVKSGQLFVASCDKSRMENTIMSLVANYQTYPEPWQILICRSSTTAEELSLFTKRCFFAASNGYEKRLFCIANLEVLDFELQFNLVNDIRVLCETKEQYNLALVCCPEGGIHHHILDQFREHHITNGLDARSMVNIYAEICQDVICVSSDLSGQGKTEWIRQASMAKGLIPRSFLISDDVQFGKLVRQLKESNLRKFESLHLNILSVNHPGELNRFLFELLTLGMVSNEVDIAELPKTSIFIEVASTVDQYLLNSLPFTSYLANEEIDWKDNNFIVSLEPTSPIQVVARYLDAYSRGTLNETDISLSTGDPIPANRCKELLDQYFFDENAKSISSYRYIEIFANVLADQLIRMSASTYFQVENIKLMVGERERDIRSLLVQQFVETGKEFSTRSIASKIAQLENKEAAQSENIAEADTARLGAILPWEESNHLLVVFLSQPPDSIAAFYSDREKVPANVKTLLQSQQARRNSELEDYHEMSPEILLNRLESLARKSMELLILPSYALSADNLLKMSLILLRARAHIPVVICGEAGCGKTSLIHFLSMMVEVEFEALNLHAGIQEEKILESISKATKKAKKGEVWMFFDEINTCNHIGILADLIAHRTLNGKLIHHNIRLFAAANPYRMRVKAQSSAGLKTKQSRYEERNNLVYQVHPLPDQILDYVWDYGILKRKDEYLYIQIMVKSLGKWATDCGLPELLSESQQFIRETEEPYSVSLRDVKRAIKLVRFFYDSFQERANLNNVEEFQERANLNNVEEFQERANLNNVKKYEYKNNHPCLANFSIFVRCCCLALGLCYQARLYEKDLRFLYRRKMAAIFRAKKIIMSSEDFNIIIKAEQQDYFDRMTIGPSIAANSALLENILVMIVSILTRIPVFIIGAPGSSKSLAMRLISQNLRGTDSSDPYFRKLPGVYVVPHQGSSSSTSEGILKVFDKAHNYQKTSSKEFKSDSDPENSKKFLDCPEVSVIGISNWRLDNSKSSRALLVQRPKFDRDDLLETSKILLGNKADNFNQSKYEFLADAYLAYEKDQDQNPVYPNFHASKIQEGLVRNFGGTEKTQELCEKYFGRVLRSFNGNTYDYRSIPVDELINANLDDKNARHLMVIGKSDSLIDILAYQLRQRNLNPVVICGSQFPDDKEDYSYAVLKRIMMCVEAGRPLILSDLEPIYGSLYDLWNQNYYTAGTKADPKHFTRVALGAYSNPMCFVHENFRCILIMDETRLKFADLPLLNRFEKQRMNMNDTLNENQKHLVEVLAFWVRQISTLAEMDFSENDMFIGFNAEETVQSLVIDNCQKNPNLDNESIMEKCKESLISIATSDGIVRSEKSVLATADRNEVAYWKNFYLVHQRHDSLYAYFEDLLRRENDNFATKSHQTIINTFSNIHTDVQSILEDLVTCQIEKLSTFKTEAQLQNRIKHFWLESDSQLLILQCNVSVSKTRCIKLAKFIIEQLRSEYLARHQQPNKHACIILHTQRKNEINSCSFSFMCGWEQITIELLTPQENTLSNLLNGNLSDTIEFSYPFQNIFQEELLWCLSCIKYPSTPKSVAHLRHLLQEIPNHPNFINIIKARVQQYLLDCDSNNWQLQVASNKRSLYLYSSLLAALQSHVRETIRKPIAKILCSLERLSAIRTFLEIDNGSEENNLSSFWGEMFMDKRIVNIDLLQEPKPDTFIMANAQHKLRFPFSLYFFKRINNFEKFYREEVSLLSEDDNNLDEESGLLKHIMENLQNSFTKKILAAVPALRSPLLVHSMKSYYNDFITILSSEIIGNNIEKLMAYIVRSELSENDMYNPIKLHIYWWNNGDSMTSKLNLAKLCPNVVETMLSNEYFGDNTDYLLLQVINMIFEKFYDLANEEQENENEEAQIQHKENIRNWQRLVNIVLLLCSKLSISSNTQSFNLLRICNDLVSAKSIPLCEIREIIYNSQRNTHDELMSIETINAIFALLDKLELKESHSNSPRQSFILRCLNIIEFDSPIREYLYEKIFSQKPFPLMGSIILRIFETEEIEQEGVFFSLIENPQETLKMSSRLQVINECLKKGDINSQMATLCVDTIQKGFFVAFGIHDLASRFHQAIETLCDPKNSEPLQLLSSIAYFKEFVHKFWRSIDSFENSLNQEVQFTFMETEQTVNLIEDITQSLFLPNPLIHSLAVYFLKELRSIRFSIEQIKQFSQVQQRLLPWISELPWSNDTNRTRLPINPFWTLDAYTEAENAYRFSYTVFNNSRLDTLLKSLLQSQRVDERVAFIGLLLARLHSPRIIAEELQHCEKRIYTHLSDQIKPMNLSPVYKETIMKLLDNKHPFIHLNPQAEDSRLLLVSVITHIIAVNASLPPDHSPLSFYLHRLQECQKSYILTCPSDLESMFLNVLLNSTHRLDSRTGLTRYKCRCGYIYYIGNCGLPGSDDDKSVCPECKTTLGGIDHKVPEGHVKLDAAPLRQNLQEDQVGYIVETCNTVQSSSVRAMIPASYRILHLFIHVIFGISIPPPIAKTFFVDVPDPVQYCLDHIKNDWEILKRIFNCSDEILALLLHAILFKMLKEPKLDPVKLNTADERVQWERFFTNELVVPLEISETIEISEQYSQEYLPRLWRKVRDTTYENLHAYFTSNPQNSVKYPFLDLFFKYEERLRLIKNIRPIIKFVQLLSKQLSHRITRKEARELTFQAFINKSDENESRSLETAFTGFKDAWNSVIPYVTRFQCHDLEQKPAINEEFSIVYGLIEPKGESQYLCAILDVLVSIQNEFLQEVVTIPPGSCSSLRFLETEGIREQDFDTLSTSATATHDRYILYYLKTLRLENIRPSNIINHEWDDAILEFSQRKLEVLHGEEIEYDLHKMEMELARKLVFDKVYIEAIDVNLYLENFLYHMESFHQSMTLINEVKVLLPQEPIPIQIKRNYNGQEGSLSFETPSDLRSSLEILLCFVKRTAIDDRDMLIAEYIKQWMSKSSISENKIFQVGMQLKHIVDLYELVEDKVADLMVDSVDNKYKSKISADIEFAIMNIVEFESMTQHQSKQIKKQFPAAMVATALKRFIVRHLSDDQINANVPLSSYLCNASLNLWPPEISEELLDEIGENEIFPNELLVEHTYEVYQFIRVKLQNEAMKRRVREENIKKTRAPLSTSSHASPSRNNVNRKNRNGRNKWDRL
ncbi:4682_t:CDS:10 [Ambispora gerdemannii]|uniref:4682_t:CDS:1 n=1 Tax=Ambispora gerdemannii TaxID=144530 RepID=A0A9N8ZD55_9GLOM|nr:4682_t:CDS:10 [Ambispora gerdemannii]